MRRLSSPSALPVLLLPGFSAGGKESRAAPVEARKDELESDFFFPG